MQTLQLPHSVVFAHDLEKFVFLKDLTIHELEKLAAIARFEDVPRGYRLAAEGSPAETFHIVARGLFGISMRLENGTEVVSQRIGNEEMCGWSWVVAPHTWSFNVTALENSRILTFDAQELRQLLEDNPRIGYELMKKMTAALAFRLQDTRRQLYGRRQNRPTRGVEL